MFCRSCGENIPVDSVFCPNCGKNLLEVGSRAAGTDSSEWESGQDDKIPSRRSRRGHIIDEFDSQDDAPEPEPRMRVPIHVNWAMWERLGLMRVLWSMGLAFSAVGFIVGVAGNPARALTWILFGFALIVAAPHASGTAAPTEAAEEEEANE